MNMACIRLFEGIKYVLPILHPNKKRLALIMCPEEDSASVEWARRKDENWVNTVHSGVAGGKWSGSRKRPSI